MPGVSLGPEEKKTGLKGSSTRPLILADAVIPRENLLGEVGKGHKIAFNILNIGRWKLGAAVTGGGKRSLGESVQYAKGRLAFGRPISDFGLIRHKLGEMAILTYAAESAVYRTAGLLDRSLASVDPADGAARLARIEEYDVEASMVKVWCSEMLAYVVDETVQIHGGAGFVQDYPAEKNWRDSRVYRIFEGTNEINRLLVPGRLLRRALKGELPLFDRAAALLAEAARKSGPAATAPGASAAGAGVLDDVEQWLAGAKKIALLSLALAAQRFGQGLSEEQEILGGFADMAMEVFVLESALLRTQKLAAAMGVERVRLQEAVVRCFAQDALDRIEVRARRVLAAVEEDRSKLAGHLAAVARFAVRPTLNTIALRRLVAMAAIDADGYPL
jgi:hypothetical protein